MKQKTYKTKQRSILLDFFAEHPENSYSAADLITSGELDMGAATIYRQLAKLSEEGSLNKIISSASDGAKYQFHPPLDCDKHIHLRCTKCGALELAECHFAHDLEEHLDADHGFTVDPKKTVIFGICRSCKEK